MDSNLIIEEGNDVLVKNVVSEMQQYVTNLSVVDEASYNKMTTLYAQARGWHKTIDNKRKELGDPFRKQITLINDRAKELLDPLDVVINMSNHKANSYMRMLEQLKKEADESIKLAAFLFDEEVPYIPPMEKTVRGTGANTVTKTERKFRVVDRDKIPSKYLIVDESAIKRDLALGLAKIPGIEVYEEKTTQLRVK